MEIKEIFDTVDSMKDEYLEFLKDVTALESPTEKKEYVDACGEYFVKAAQKRGWLVEKAHMERSGDAICITLNPDAKGELICLSGHIDTVHPIGLYGTPVEITVKDGWICGPGVGDCKGGVVGGFMAMDVLSKLGYKDKQIRLLIQTDEEVSSSYSDKQTIKFICEKAKGASAFFNLESSKIPDDCVIERKGIAKYRFEVTGKPMHAAACYNKDAASAILEAAYKIAEIEKYKNPDGITANVGLIQGGTATNTVPALCTFSVDFRYKNKQDLEEIEKFVDDLSKKSTVEGTSCKYVRQSFRISMPLCERNEQLREKAKKIFEECGLPSLIKGFSGGGSDAADVTEYGIPVIDSIGIFSRGIHTENECAEIESLYTVAKRMACYIVKS